MSLLLSGLFGVSDESIYLSPAPLYHSAPLGFCTAIQAAGGTVVAMEKFDAAEALRLIDKHKITHSQWVPTMFSRMLKLDKAELEGHDWSSHKVAIHAAAPCPVEVKRQMFDLWGPIIYEYYAGTEVNGFVFCRPEDWLAHPGTVGQSILGPIHICDDEGNDQPNGEPGTIYFEREEMPFEYHNDSQKTRDAQHPEHPSWSTLGDVGYLDDEGFLFLTDRKAFMIISGGVNIYPQEIEDCLIMHPKVADVAVFGVPNADLGEEVKAVVQTEDGVEPSDELARELVAYAGGAHRALQGPSFHRFQGRAPPAADRQALQAAAEGRVLGYDRQPDRLIRETRRAMPSYETIDYEVRDGVGHVRFARPEGANAVNPAFSRDLRASHARDRVGRRA